MRYNIAAHARAGGKARMQMMTAEEHATMSSQGGRSRMAQLDKAGRKALARRGLAGLADRHFGGDLHAAQMWLVAKGLHLQDPGRGTAWELYPDPGPLPSSIQPPAPAVHDRG